MALAQKSVPAPVEHSHDESADPALVERIARHLAARVAATPLMRDPFCHIYNDGMFPDDVYRDMLAGLPEARHYTPLNPRLYARSDGVSTRDQLYLTPDAIAALPAGVRPLWSSIVAAVMRPELRRAVFTKLAPDLAERFETSEAAVSEMGCVHEVVLMRDTEDYVIKPHPDGLNKIVTMQFYLPPDMSQLALGTSLYRRHKRLLTSTFEEVKRFEFRPNSGYAFAVSDSPKRQSWHGREVLTGFKGVRNTLMVLFQQSTKHDYAM
jgi:hypothetical protein